MGHIPHPLIPLIPVLQMRSWRVLIQVLGSKGSLAQNRALCEHSGSCQLACVNLYVPHRRFQLWTKKKYPATPMNRCSERKKKKRGFQCRANVDGFLHLYLRIIFLFFFLFYLLKLSTDHIMDREKFLELYWFFKGQEKIEHIKIKNGNKCSFFLCCRSYCLKIYVL